jgi:hypothetical protein
VIFSIATALAVTSAAFFLQPQQISPAEIDSQRLLFRGVGGEALVFKWLVFLCSLRVELGVFPTTCGIEKLPISYIVYTAHATIKAPIKHLTRLISSPVPSCIYMTVFLRNPAARMGTRT